MRNVVMILGVSAVVLWCMEGASGKEKSAPRQPRKMSANQVVGKYKDKVAVIDTTKGRIIVAFYPEDAPNTVNNFCSLADQEFYDGLIFHRVIKGFMIQGGCPHGSGTGGPGWEIDAEFNKQKHLEGTVAMARSQNPNSAGSQFYICLGPQPNLDGAYTVFGQVAKGMDIVKAIGEVKTDSKDRPLEKVMIVKIRIMDKDKAEQLD